MKTQRAAAFTLVELMVSTAIIGLIMIMLVQVTGQTSSIWRYTSSKAEQFREARSAFETMTRRISQATLNTYWDYDDPEKPKIYERNSELRFVSGPMQSGSRALDNSNNPPRPTHGIFFQAPFGFVAPARSGDSVSSKYEGLDSLLNTWGYYIEVNNDDALKPNFIKTAPRIRSRLMELMEPSGAMSIYKYTSGVQGQNPAIKKAYKAFDWFRNAFPTSDASNAEGLRSHVIAENIIALAILPRLSDHELTGNSSLKAMPAEQREAALAPNYFYHSAENGAGGTSGTVGLQAVLNSKHQLPPVLQVTMVAIDETSAQRIGYQDINDDPFQVQTAGFLSSAREYREDLFLPAEPTGSEASLEARLIKAKVNYRIFTTSIHLRGAKWSKDQVK